MRTCFTIIRNEIILILTGALLALGLLALVFSIPGDSYARHLEQSAALFEEEGTYPTWFDGVLVRMHPDNATQLKTILLNNRITARDNCTDALMLANAGFTPSQSTGELGLMDRVLSVYRYGADDVSPVDSLLDVYANHQTAVIASYDRYWHGYLLFLKPLLFFFSYGQIRIINLFALLALSACVYRRMQKKITDKGIRRIFLISLLFFMPFTIPFCLQYSTCTYITLLGLFFLLGHQEFLRQKNRCAYFFLLLGLLTSFIDYLTYPLITFGIPMLFLWLLEPEKPKGNRQNFLFFLSCGASWCFGYVGMWAMKWILGSVILQKNLLVRALEQVRFRASSQTENGEETISLFQALGSNLCNYVNIFYILLLLVLLVWALRICLRRRKLLVSHLKENYLPVLLSLSPFVWYCAFANHSYSHGSFTFRALWITAFAGLLFFYQPFRLHYYFISSVLITSANT